MSVISAPRDPFSKISTTELCELRGDKCECCGGNVWNLGGPEANHCLVPDRKRHKPVCDYLINIELVCHKCHVWEEVHTFYHRIAFRRKQEERYSVADVEAFFRMLDSLGYMSDGIAEA